PVGRTTPSGPRLTVNLFSFLPSHDQRFPPRLALTDTFNTLSRLLLVKRHPLRIIQPRSKLFDE
ncbi:hypothetical protein FRC08_015739, partial [Ceratobasidium sp. 394]